MKPSKLRAALINTTSEIGHHGCTLVCRRIRELAAEAGIEIDCWLPLKMRPDGVDWTQFDLVIVNGEGSLHHDRPGAHIIAEFGTRFAKINRPAYLINSVYQGNSAEIADGVARYRKIWVRESRSAADLSLAGVAASVVPDLSLTWNGDGLGRHGDRLVFLDAVDLAETRTLYQMARELRAPFYSIMTRPPVIDSFPNENRARIAKHAWRRLVARLSLPSAKRARTLGQFGSFQAFASYLAGQAAAIVTGRFHAVCIAFDLEIPVFALPSNTHKIESMLVDIGLENRLIRNPAEFASSIATAERSTLQYSDTEIELLRIYKTAALQSAREMFAVIAQDCSH